MKKQNFEKQKDKMSKVFFKVENIMDKSCFKHAGRFFTSLFGFFRNFFLVRADFTKVEHFLNENMENISIISKIFPEWQASCKFCFNALQQV